MMIRLPLKYRERPIQLLGKNQAHHDVREGELREGQLRVLTGIDGVGETVRTADDEGERFQSCVGTLLDKVGELLGGQLLAALIPQNHKLVGLYLLENQFPLALLLLLHRHGLGILQIRNRHRLVRDVGGDFGCVLPNGGIENVAIGFANPYQFYFHTSCW